MPRSSRFAQCSVIRPSSSRNLWEALRDEGLAGMTMLGRHLHQTGQLRAGIGLDEVRDLLWNYLAIDHYERLVLSQGWAHERYARWLAGAITGALCP